MHPLNTGLILASRFEPRISPLDILINERRSVTTPVNSPLIFLMGVFDLDDPRT